MKPKVVANNCSEDSCSVSSDSGNGESVAVTPADSLNELENEPSGSSLNLYEAYNAFTAFSESLGSVLPGHAMVFEFEIPQILIGRLIGRHGANVHKIKLCTGANILVKRHHNSITHKICAVEGLCSEIMHAVEMIRKRFPVKRFPCLNLDQVNHQRRLQPSSIPILPSNNKLILIEGVSSDVTVCSADSLHNIFLQHPCHPTYPALCRLHETLATFYEEAVGAPQLLRPFNVGIICVARLSSNEWYRAEVVHVDEEQENCRIKLVDVGGYIKVSMKNLRQIRVDFVTIPFQATEVCLANITPNIDIGWSKEAIHHFKYLCKGQVLRAHVVGYDVDNDTTLIHLFKINGRQPPVLINQELAEYGLVKWIADAPNSKAGLCTLAD